MFRFEIAYEGRNEGYTSTLQNGLTLAEVMKMTMADVDWEKTGLADLQGFAGRQILETEVMDSCTKVRTTVPLYYGDQHVRWEEGDTLSAFTFLDAGSRISLVYGSEGWKAYTRYTRRPRYYVPTGDKVYEVVILGETTGVTTMFNILADSEESAVNTVMEIVADYEKVTLQSITELESSKGE